MTPAPCPDVQLDDDATIIERSWREPERFALLFDRHAARIHRYVARRVGREVADDLVAETFLAAFAKRRGYFTAYRDAGPWLYGIATNLVGQHRREEVRQFRIRQAAWPELAEPGHAEAEPLALGHVSHGGCSPLKLQDRRALSSFSVPTGGGRRDS